ncbi:TATA box-binding protein-associated factor RNA polymerase I subunit C [Cheilinus undulatus]|uniref:TATA box-binding protein-associated factor RNA polymerase I subunit C n=1 Tax=Cheilinus undulatus TaxID=241271 RepID=UPI001BD2761E|nr:TATA box-binding protein-associated factor RNA polymerase I subunit C [Cheilinus undulatus]
MDYEFPQQLFPSFYNCGPPDSVLKHCAGNWGCYDRLRPQSGSGPLSGWTFTSRHQVRGQTWQHTEPIPVPLLSPKNTYLWPVTPPDPMDFKTHMQNFFMDHCQDAFGCMSDIVGEYFYFSDGKLVTNRMGSVNMWKVENFLKQLDYKICHISYRSNHLDGCNTLLFDSIHSIPPEVLGGLLHEELTEQRDHLLFSEGATGGSLAFIPFSQGCSNSRQGCLIYPGNQGLNCLNFHKVELQYHRGGSSCVDASRGSPFSFQLKGPVRQISADSLLNQSCVAVRSDYFCGVWKFVETNEPQLLQVVNTREVATCIGVSPHVLGEVLVASESGVVNLWTVGKGMQKIREEDSNLYFNAKSSWRWCEFSAHPRVMLYADRTGVELTDIRMSQTSSHTLFRISNTSECRSGERLILSKYLGDSHCFHHLVTTQYSAYIMDERFPGIPMLKMEHMMLSPPMFCHVVLGSSSSSAVGGATTTKVLLGSQSSQEITMLQYSGGQAEACSSHGLPQALLRPRDSLRHLPAQLPHRHETANNRLSIPAAGLTCIQTSKGKETDSSECICVLQLTEAGDIFYQILEPEQQDTSPSQTAEEETLTQQTLKDSAAPGRKTTADSQTIISETSSDEDIIGPTQAQTAQIFVAETQDLTQQGGGLSSDSSCEDSELGGQKRRKLKHLKLQVIVNDDPEPDQVNGLDDAKRNGKVGENNLEKPKEVKKTVSSSSTVRAGQTQVKLSDGALISWKHWLQKLMKKSYEEKPRQRQLQHFTEPSNDILKPLARQETDSAEEERIKSLRRDLRACMSKRLMLVHSAISTSIKAPPIEGVPESVHAEAWTDELSERLTASWQGEDAWRAWWDDSLGLNKEKKVAALRRKRRREKEARRASRRLELSGSFTSSLSYQAELSDFSDSQGWSSAGSQGAWSDTGESIKSQPVGMKESGTPKAVPATPQSVRAKPDKLQTPSSSRTLTLPPTPRVTATPPSQRKNKRPGQDILSSLFAPQVEPSQLDGYFHEEESSVQPTPPPAASSYQLHSSQSVSQRSLRVDLSQDTCIMPQFSQSSQGRPRLPQTSQPKKKKSRMGF